MRRHSALTGMTILEVTVASALFLLLTTLMVKGLQDGVRSWRFLDSKSTVQDQLEKLIWEMEREVEASNIASHETSAAPPGLAFSSAYGLLQDGDRDSFLVDPQTGRCLWRKYLCYYLNPTAELKRSEKALGAGLPAHVLPLPLSSVDFSSGPQPLSFYLTGGRTVAERVESFEVVRFGQSIELTLDIKGEKSGSHRFHTTFWPRN